MIIFYVLLYFSLLLIFILQVIIIHHLFTNLALQWSKKSYLSRASIMVCHQRSQTWGIINGGSSMTGLSSYIFFHLFSFFYFLCFIFVLEQPLIFHYFFLRSLSTTAISYVFIIFYHLRFLLLSQKSNYRSQKNNLL